MGSMERMGEMSERAPRDLLRPGDRAPNVVLEEITHEGQIAIDDFRGKKPLLIGLFRGLHCPLCRRHLAVQAQIDRKLREKGVESIAVVNTPIERARLYFRYHPMPDLLAASDPERISHRAFGLPIIDIAESLSAWQRSVGCVATAVLNGWDRYKLTEVDQQMAREGGGQLFGQFLIDRDGIIRWSFTEVPADGGQMFARPTPQQLIEAASQVTG
jgi:peroxiredoxin